MRFVPLFLCLFTACPVSAEGPPCQLCSASQSEARPVKPRRALSIDVETALDFSRVAQTGQGGEIAVDETTGARRVAGGLADLGGMALRGTVLVRGEPFAAVLISLPSRVTLRASNGGSADVTDLRTDVQAAPMLDANGELRFSFGGRLIVKGQVSGTLRGSIPISADYP